MPPKTAERAQQIRDLKNQIGSLSGPDVADIVFQESSPPKQMQWVYSMLDGQPIEVPVKRLETVLSQTLPDGGYMFTAREEDAPTYRLGEVKCFLHPDSPERETLDTIGLAGAVCHSEHLASAYSRRKHAENRHKGSWATYQEWLQEQKEAVVSDRQERQLEATLALAGKAVEAPEPEAACDYPDCNYTGTPQQVGGHKGKAHR